MYRAIIVDDELLIRVAYQSIVNWQDYGFELAGVFENGQAALDAFEQLKPDFVLTDTRMPICDGIELIRQIKQKYPETICVILSAYGDLDYVKEGMRAGAEDYLLKLDITSESLGALLSSTADKLKNLKHSQVESVSQELEKGRDEFLRRWILGEIKERDTLTDYLKFYKIRLSRSLICMIIQICPENPEDFKEELQETAKRTIGQTLFSSGTWLLADLRFCIFCAIGCCDDSNPDLYAENAKKSLLFSLRSVMNFSNVSIKWKYTDEILSVPRIFSQLIPSSSHPPVPVYDMVQEVVNQLLQLHYPETAGLLKKIRLQFLENAALSPSALLNNCSYILMGLQTSMKHDSLLAQWLQDSIQGLTEDLSGCFSPRDFARWINHLNSLLEEMMKNRAPAASMAERAAKYIQKHFTEEIFLDNIADYCGVSPAYLSRIFSQEHGKGVLEYLTELRIRKAKELLSDTNEKIYRIAALSGYSDAVYFNKVFKKNTGMTPREYRLQKKTIKDKK